MSVLTKITPENQVKLGSYLDNIQDSIKARFIKIADPDSMGGFLNPSEVNDANKYISALPACAADCDDHGLEGLAKEQVALKKLNPESTARECDLSLTLRRLRSKSRKRREAEMLLFRQVHLYSSWRAERDSKQQAIRAESILSKRLLKTEKGTIPLNEIAENSRVLHTWETLHRLSSLAEIMTNNNWQASFTVQTLPSRFHPKSKKWDGTMPDEAHAWSNQKWSNVRATLSQRGYEEGLDFMVIRTVEPHKDGCPHYNLVAIGSIKFLKDFNKILHEKYLYAGNADGREDGAKKRRLKVKFAKGKKACRKIVSYAAKYALKTYLPEEMHKTKKHAKAHARALAWRQTWNIRAFSLIGFAPVSLWRECRSKHYGKADIDLVRYATETNWVSFQKEFFNIGKKNIKPIHEMRQNRFLEDVQACVGHFIKDTNKIIAERISKAIIVAKPNDKKQGVITVIESKPRGESKSKTQAIFDQFMHPPPDFMTA